MPGILGLIRHQPWDETPIEIVHRMAEPLRFESTQQVDSFTLGRCAGAVVGYGKDFSFLKPAVAEREHVLVWIDGEVFPEANEVPPELNCKDPTIQRADYCLHFYLELGTSFVRCLNGAFAMAVFDGRDQTLHLYTDRFRSRPLYIWQGDGECAFASSVRSLLKFRNDIGRTYDRFALAELFVFTRVFGEKTLFPDIRRLDTACHATWNGSQWMTKRYVDPFNMQVPENLHKWQDAARELVSRLRRALDKRLADKGKAAVLISGGIDSRLILAACPHPVAAATFANKGQPPSMEVRTAQAIARALDFEPLLLERVEDYYATIAEPAVEATDALSSFAECHTIGIHRRLRDAGIQVILTGLYFDTVFKCFYGRHTFPIELYPNGPAELRARIIARILADSTLTRRRERQDLLTLAFSDEMQEVVAVARERFIRRLADWMSQDAPMPELADRFPINDLQSAVGGSIGFARGISTTFIDRSPIYDNDLMALGWSLPTAWKLRGRIVRRAVKLVSPKLARIQDANTRLPAGLVPPWDQWIGQVRRGTRDVGKRLIGLSKKAWLFRSPAKGQRVFTQGAWHDLNGALRLCPSYRKLVEECIEQLDPRIFHVDRMRAFLQDDLAAPAPRLNTLFEILITFSLFDRKWGPKTRPVV